MIDKIKKNKVSELPDWVSNQMKEVIKWMMNNNENHRPTTKMILSHDTVLMYLRSCEDREQSKQEKIEALNKRDLHIEERNQERIEKNRVIDEKNRIQSDYERALAERDRERIEKDRLQIELNRQIQERNGLQSDNERALAERDRERIEKDRLQIELNRERIEKERFKYEKEQEKRRTETTQSEVIRLTAEVQRLSQSIQSFPPSLNPNMLVGIIPDIEVVYQKGIKIIRTDKRGCSTVAFNPIISNGIVRFGGFLEDPDDDQSFFSIGIADSSAVFGSNQLPFDGENKKKTVCYFWRFENVQYSSAKGVSNGKVFKWGQQWKQ
ncbi:MAG: hypothetical protein EZS28_034028 [Streblomastix strix]|uniref:Protein kinase domain-containing protein n=1 Tax=Streblomastix strix TaxID=222440 RepID=A0A5J4UKY6_9EUKA|nr:MAG: hypothetical protein EZS28_034028 [Streblomastix strix]